jgi:hypothetical protein
MAATTRMWQDLGGGGGGKTYNVLKYRVEISTTLHLRRKTESAVECNSMLDRSGLVSSSADLSVYSPHLRFSSLIH